MVEVSRSSHCDYIKYIFSSALLLFATTITVYSILYEKTAFWGSVPGSAALGIFIIDLIMLGIVEGLQIALVELKRQTPESYRKTHPRAYRLGVIAGKNDNVERFLMGRQVFVVFLVFFIAKLTTVTLEDLDDFLFPVPQWFYVSMLETGFLTCILVVIVAQLMPQIVASQYPVHFLDLWLMQPAYYACTMVEKTGITHACWLLSHVMSKLTGAKAEDEVLKNTVIMHEMTRMETSDEEALHVQHGFKLLGAADITSESALEDIGSILDNVTHQNVDETKKSSLDDQDKKMKEFHNLFTTLQDEVDPDIRKILQFYLDSHPEKFRNFPSVIGNRVYLPPQTLANEMKEQGSEIPGFLRDISDPNHVPPHIVAFKLLQHISELQRELTELRNKC